MLLEKDLRPLSLTQLKKLAKDNGVKLELPDWTSSVGKTRPAKTKPEIIAVLKSSKITKKKIKEILKKKPTKDRDVRRVFTQTQKNEILF